MDLRPDRKSNLALLASEMERANPSEINTAEETDGAAVLEQLRKLFPKATVRVMDATGAPGGYDLALSQKIAMAQVELIERSRQATQRELKKAQAKLEQRLQQIEDMDPLGDRDSHDFDVYGDQPSINAQVQAANTEYSARHKAIMAKHKANVEAAKVQQKLAGVLTNNAKVRRDSELGTKPSVIVFGGVGSGRAAFQLPETTAEEPGEILAE